MLACLNDPAFGQVYLTYTESKYTGSCLEDCGNNTVLHIYSSGISRISINGTFEEKELLKWVSEVKDRASAASCFDEDIIYLAGWGNLFRYSVSKDSVETLEGFQNGIVSPYFARDTSDHLYLNSDSGIFRIEKQGSFRELGKIPESGYIRSFAVLDSQDILVSTSNNWLFHFVGKEVDTIGFPCLQYFQRCFRREVSGRPSQKRFAVEGKRAADRRDASPRSTFGLGPGTGLRIGTENAPGNPIRRRKKSRGDLFRGSGIQGRLPLG